MQSPDAPGSRRWPSGHRAGCPRPAGQCASPGDTSLAPRSPDTPSSRDCVCTWPANMSRARSEVDPAVLTAVTVTGCPHSPSPLRNNCLCSRLAIVCENHLILMRNTQAPEQHWEALGGRACFPDSSSGKGGRGWGEPPSAAGEWGCRMLPFCALHSSRSYVIYARTSGWMCGRIYKWNFYPSPN